MARARLTVGIFALALLGCDAAAPIDGGLPDGGRPSADAASLDAGPFADAAASPDGGPRDGGVPDDGGSDAGGELDASGALDGGGDPDASGALDGGGHVDASGLLDGGAELDASGALDGGGSPDGGPSDAASPTDAGPGCVVPTDYATIAIALADPACGAIEVLAGTYAENLAIDRAVSLFGTGAVVIDGSDAGSVITVGASAVVRLANLTVQNGLARFGGGIFNQGELTLEDVIVTGNEASEGSGPRGGGIFNQGTLTLRRSRVEQNVASGAGARASGGGIFSLGGALTLSEASAVERNVVRSTVAGSALSTAYGGGVGLESATLEVAGGCSISENLAEAEGSTGAAAALGGGVYAHASTVELRGATLASNDVGAASAGLATSAGGGIYAEAASIVRVLEGSSVASSTVVATGAQTTRGGGIAVLSGELTVDASEVVENTVTASRMAGGGLYCAGTLVIRGSTVRGNRLEAPAGAASPILHGGGIYGGSPILIEAGSVIRDNALTALDYGGSATALGAGLFHGTGTCTVDASAVEENRATLETARSASSATVKGGGIYAGGTELHLVGGARVAGNLARAEAASTALAHGGGIIQVRTGSGGTLTAEGAQIEANVAEALGTNARAWGGGVYSENGAVQLTECGVADNYAHATGFGLASGGGVYVAVRAAVVAGEASIVRSTVSGNRAEGDRLALGGGVLLEVTSGVLGAVIDQSTLSANRAIGGDSFGGGLMASAITPSVGVLQLFIDASTLTGNTATYGGGLFADTSTVPVVRSTILYGNGAGTGPDCATQVGASLESVGYDLFGTQADCAVTGARTGDRVGMDPLLGPLADNGGPTLTHLIGAGGAAHEAGDPACADHLGVAYTIDQRGQPRPQGICDIGAIERAP